MIRGIDLQLLAEKAAAVERHPARVAERLPDRSEELRPACDASDVVIRRDHRCGAA